MPHFKKPRLAKRVLLVSVAFVVLLGASVLIERFLTSAPGKHPAPQTQGLPTYTTATLASYNGASDTLPIYVALDGYVYDVTAGKEFYAPGGTYHFIAGKDASQELHLFGGGIIREKYPVVGTFIES